MMATINTLKELANMLDIMEQNTKDNANDLYKEFGDTDTYANYRMSHFTIGRLFTYKGLKYEVLEIDTTRKLVTYKRLGFTFKRAPSGRRLKRYGKFGITSTMDLTLKFVSDNK